MELPQRRNGAPIHSGEIILEVNELQKYYPVQGSSLADVLGFGEKRYVKAVERR